MSPAKRSGGLRWLAGLSWPYRGKLLVAAASLAISGAVSLMIPLLAGRVVDAALVDKSLGRLRDVVLGLLVVFAVSSVLDYLETWLIQSSSTRILAGLRARLHAHLLTLTPAFYDTQRVGDSLSRINADVEKIGTAITRNLVSGLQRSVVLVGSLAVLFAVHLRLTGVMLLAIPPVIIAAVLFGRRFQALSKREQDAEAEAGVAAEESLSGIRTVQAFAREPEERARYGDRLAKLVALELRTTRTWGVFSAITHFAGYTAFTLVLWYGSSLIVQGRLSAGQLTSFLLYTGLVAGAVGSLTALYGTLRAAAGATERVRALLDTRPDIQDAPDATPVPSPLTGAVAYRDVHFTYPSAASPALDGVSLDIPPGSVAALVGPSGGGKTTLASLLLRFRDPQAGRVEVDGRDIRTLKLASLRGAIGFVPQDVFLFGGTVAENIRYGKPEATDEEVRAAAEAAQAAGFIGRLAKQYDTVIGERGVMLSAGERQRVAIARVFLKAPGIVVLDEATSALDAESEHLVQKAFDRLFIGRTTLIIAHRLATVRRANRVFLIDRGRIAEQGSHEELYAANGAYRRLCDLQLLT